MSVKIEQIEDGCVTFLKSLGLLDRLEPPHTSFSDSSGLMGKLCSIVGVLLCVMTAVGDQRSVRALSLSRTVAAQFVCDDLSGYAG